jgi:hypothetical protein
VDTVNRRTPSAASLDGAAVAALTCGAVGLFMFNIVFGPIAVVLGTASLRRDASGRPGRAAALAGLLLGIADLVVLVVLIAGKVHGGTFGWRLGS